MNSQKNNLEKSNIINLTPMMLGITITVLLFAFGNLFLYKANASDVNKIESETKIKIESIKESTKDQLKYHYSFIEETKRELEKIREDNNKRLDEFSKKIDAMNKELNNKFQEILKMQIQKKEE